MGYNDESMVNMKTSYIPNKELFDRNWQKV